GDSRGDRIALLRVHVSGPHNALAPVVGQRGGEGAECGLLTLLREFRRDPREGGVGDGDLLVGERLIERERLRIGLRGVEHGGGGLLRGGAGRRGGGGFAGGARGGVRGRRERLVDEEAAAGQRADQRHRA